MSIPPNLPQDTPFIHVQLQTKQGEVVGTFVNAMAPFPAGALPEVVFWGTRVFTHHEDPDIPAGKPLAIYREGLPWTISGRPIELADQIPATTPG